MANALVKGIEIDLKKIGRPNLFLENEQWNIVHMKEEFHP